MKIQQAVLFFLAFATLAGPVLASQSSFGEVFCKSMKGTGMVLRCSSLRSEKIVAAFIDTTDEEASKMCRGIVGLMSQYQNVPKAGWRLQIYSPFDNIVPLASCKF